MTKWVYNFGGDTSEGGAGLRNLLGGKGANLAEMAAIGLPVPPGFTITTEVCTYFYANDRQYPADLNDQIAAGVASIERAVGAKFGDPENPLLVSVRSGARVSMPGMMDTVLNLGLNDETVEGLARASGDPRFAYDSYRRFIQMYADVVMGVDHHDFEDLLSLRKDLAGVEQDMDLTAEDLKALIQEYRDLVVSELGKPFPQDVHEQLWGAVSAVFGSWQIHRAVVYRRLHGIPEEWGTAVNVQAMVFGNMGENCATGVAFTRDPGNGENIFFGEFLVNAQGEDVVAGIRTPQHLTVRGKNLQGSTLPAMEEVMPALFGELNDIRSTLESHYKEMQDVEFTVQNGKLYMLQTRTGKRTGKAAIKIARDMVAEGLIDKKTAVLRVEPQSLDQLLHPALDPNVEKKVIGKGLPASPGAASGRIVFSADQAEKWAHDGEKVMLCRVETSPEDIHGMHAAEGIVTTRGGMTSHAAVVARGMGRPCVAGAGDVTIDYAAGTFSVGDAALKEGDWITIDGAAGEIFAGRVPTVQPEFGEDFAAIMAWADEVRRLGVRANAETPEDVRTARDFGAEGIGLCRTEHMFFEGDRIVAVREMILAETEEGRRAALDQILPMQRADFVELFTIMKGLPVTVRLLDPPLHEFLPREKSEFDEIAAGTGVSVEKVRRRAAQLQESNPMLGHRGCRLLNSYPEICEMQARAIFEAALIAAEQTGEPAHVEVMIPLVGMKKELDLLKAVIDRTADQVAAEKGAAPPYTVGTMIELPRAALRAGEIADSAAFFSFGTNDLTQTALGISRDDAGSFLGAYERQGIIESDPFQTLDTEGVGELISLARERGRATRPGLKTGICGEHGGDPRSIAFCEQVGLDYVSCSPFRVPIARLAAAQAAIRAEQES
ncbi:MAG: pyruvate, phosphate dikinase [Alphaproteobacteria bacterium]|nr:pyruvate, phosphate dikinase [Alphaproteobacteria bacterium]